LPEPTADLLDGAFADLDGDTLNTRHKQLACHRCGAIRWTLASLLIFTPIYNAASARNGQTRK